MFKRMIMKAMLLRLKYCGRYYGRCGQRVGFQDARAAVGDASDSGGQRMSATGLYIWKRSQWLLVRSLSPYLMEGRIGTSLAGFRLHISGPICILSQMGTRSRVAQTPSRFFPGCVEEGQASSGQYCHTGTSDYDEDQWSWSIATCAVI